MANQGQDVLLSVGADTRQFEKDIQKAANNINLNLNTKGFAQPLGKISGQLGEFEKSLAASNARVIAFGASAGAIYALQRALDETFKSFVNVEKSLIEINSILNVSSQDIAKFGNSLFSIAKNTGQSFSEVAKSALEFSRQGLEVEDTLKRTSDALVLARLSGLDVVSSTEAITAALNSFNLSAENSTTLINKLVAVDQGFAVSSADLAEAIKRVGSSAQDSGVSLDELVALVTSAQQTTARGGAVIGNSLKTIFTRLQRPEVLDALDELGVKTRDAEGNIAPLIQILSQLASSFQNLGGAQKSQIAELVGGVYQINILKAALGDLSKEYSIYNQALKTSQSATNEAISKNSQYNASFASLINETVANFQKAAAEIGGASLGPAARTALEGLNIALKSFSSDTSSQDIGSKVGEGIAKGIGNFLSGPGILLAIAGLYKIFERLTKFSADAFKTLLGINSVSAQQQQLQSQILTLMSKNPALIQAINSGHVQTVQLHNQILAMIEKETASLQKQIAVANSLTQSLSKAGVAISQSGQLKGIPIVNPARYKSYGFIPNFSIEQNESFGALMGGYKPGKVKKINIPGKGVNYFNTAESVVQFPGFSQPAIIPPEKSSAGKMYKDNFLKQNGFDPYRANGFIPNFSVAGLADAMQRMKTPLMLEGKNYVNIPGFEKVPQSQVDKIRKSKKFQDGIATNRREIDSKSTMLTLGGSNKDIGGHSFQAVPEVGLPRVDVTFPIRSYKDSNKKEKLEKNIGDFVKKEIESFSNELKVNPPLTPTEINQAMEQTKGLLGSIGSQAGSIFEATFRSSFGNEVREASTKAEIKKSGTFDIMSAPSGLKEFFPNLIAGVSADFKSSASPDNQLDMAFKILKAQNESDLLKKIEDAKKSRKKQLKSKGYIPNFSSVEEAFKRESQVSGENPRLLWSNTLGMPVVVNDQQIAEYGKNADRIIKKDHIDLGQISSKSNLAKTGSGKEKYKHKGYIPNFALPQSSKYYGLSNNDIKDVLDGKKAGLSGLSNALKELQNSLIGMSRSVKDNDVLLRKVAMKYSLSASESESLIKETKSLGFAMKVAKGKVSRFFDDENFSKDTKINSALRSFKEKAMWASIGLSMIGGFGESLAGENKQIGAAIQGVTQSFALATTAMSLVPGQAGLALGAIVGLAGAANAIGRVFTDKAPELEARLNSVKKDLSKFESSSQKYLQARQKVDDAFANPEKVSTNDLKKMNDSLVEAMLDLPSAYRAQLASIIDSTRLQEEINKIQKQKATEQKNLEFIIEGQKRVDDYNSLLGNLGKSFKSLFLDGSIFRDDPNKVRDRRGFVYENKYELDNAAKTFADSFSEEGKKAFSDLGKDSKLLNSFKKLNKSDFLNQLQKFGLSSTSTDFLRNLNSTEIKNFQTALSSLSRESALSEKITEATSESRKSYTKALQDEKIKVKEAEASLREFERALDLTAQSAVTFGLFSYKARNEQDNASRELSLQRASGMADYQKPFMSEEGAANLNYLLDKAKNKNAFVKDTQAVNEQSRADLLGESVKLIEELRRRTESGEIKIDNNSILDFQEALAKISSSNLSPSDMKEAIRAAYKESLSRSNINPGESERFDRELNSIIDKQIIGIQELNNKFEINNAISREQLNATLKQIDRDINLKSFGGFQGFLDPNDRERRLRDIEEASLNLNGEKTQRQREEAASKRRAFDEEDARRKNVAYEMALAKAQKEGRSFFNYSWEPVDRGERFKSSDTVEKGRAAAKLALETLATMGGVKPGESKLYDSLKNLAAQGRATDMKEQAVIIASALRKAGEEGLAKAITSRNWNQAAKDQIDEAIKTRDSSLALVDNTSQLAKDVNNILSVLNKTEQSSNQALNQGVAQAIQEGMKMMSKDFFNEAIKSSRENVNKSKTDYEALRERSELTQKILQGYSQRDTLSAEAKLRSEQVPALRGNLDLEKVDQAIINYILNKIENAKSKGQSIPSIGEIAEDAGKENFYGAGSLKEAASSIQDGPASAIREYVENLQKLQSIQLLQKQNADKLLLDQQNLNKLSQQNQSQNINQSGIPQVQPLSVPSQIPIQQPGIGNGQVTIPQGTVTIPQANVNINGNINNPQGFPISPINQQNPSNIPSINQSNGAFDPKQLQEVLTKVFKESSAGLKIGETLKAPVEQFNTAVDNFIKATESLKDSEEDQIKRIEGSINVQMDPMELNGQIDMKLTPSDPIEIELSSASINNLKEDIEKVFEGKMIKVKEDILQEVKNHVQTVIQSAISRNPRPPRYGV